MKAIRKVKFVLFFFPFLFFFSCSKERNLLEEALVQAGENRAELEKVLLCYSRSPEDSLKYRAACFLIEHMPQYYYYEGELLDSYSEYYRLLYTEKKTKPQVLLDSLDRKYGGFVLEALEKKYDIQEIDSAYLCDNIEWSFKVWQEQPWSRHVTFDDFCELCNFLESSSFNFMFKIAKKILLYEYDNNYYLLFSDLHVPPEKIIQFHSCISEFATNIHNGELFKSKLQEHGKLIIKHNALKTGKQFFSKK